MSKVLSNNQILLDEVIEQKSLMNIHESFNQKMISSNFFVAQQILKDYDLSYEEIEHGLTGVGSDGEL